MICSINERAPPASPKFQKMEFGAEKFWFSPPFSLFEKGGDTAGVNIPSETNSLAKKRFILEFQLLL